jgi:N4-gp56 family major capsid protein
MASTTTGLTALMQTFYDKVFLERAKMELRHDFGATKKGVKPNSGALVYFTRFTPLAVATTALTEATNPSAASMTAANVSATLAEYGNFVTVSSLFSMTSIDEDLKEHADVMGQNAGETIDTLIRAALVAGATTQLAVNNTLLTDIGATDVMTGAEVRRAVRTLKANKAPKFENGMYRGIIQPYTAYDLMGNSEWLDANRYTTSDAIKTGVIGKLHGVEFVESNNGYTESSTVTVYSNFIFGKNAYAMVNLDSFSAPKVFVKNPGTNSTDNPLDLFSTIGWKMPFVAKVLNGDWIINVKCGATA